MDDNTLRGLNRRISRLERDIEERQQALTALYRQRRGKVLWKGNDLAAAWCCRCGVHRVHPYQGEDTCSHCLTTPEAS